MMFTCDVHSCNDIDSKMFPQYSLNDVLFDIAASVSDVCTVVYRWTAHIPTGNVFLLEYQRNCSLCDWIVNFDICVVAGWLGPMF